MYIRLFMLSFLLCSFTTQADETRYRPKMVKIPYTQPFVMATTEVIHAQPFVMAATEVTQAQWRAVMGDNPSGFSGCDNCPVEKVSWDDVQAYLQKLNAKTGQQYRLPTEAEWEFACYGGKKTEYCGGNDANSVAWYYENSGNKTHPVGQKQANGYGLYDMSGNVSEWTQDWEWIKDCYDKDCGGRVIRGGSWDDFEYNSLGAVFRLDDSPAVRLDFIGFRVVRTLP